MKKAGVRNNIIAILEKSLIEDKIEDSDIKYILDNLKLVWYKQ